MDVHGGRVLAHDQRAPLAAGMVLASGLCLLLSLGDWSGELRFWSISLAALAAAVFLLSRLCRWPALGLELGGVMPLVWLLYRSLGYQDVALLHLPLVTAVLISSAARCRSLTAMVLGGAATALWLVVVPSGRPDGWGVGGYFLVAAATLTVLVNIAIVLGRAQRPLGFVDVIVCSYSGNTAHFARAFVRGLREEQGRVRLHRFHYYRSFSPTLRGDALVLTFPVIGWKPPWPLLWYLMTKLPPGLGKPAFISSSASGGPENAGIVTWTILTLKGYRVAGWSWAVYPLNIPALRLGSADLWRRLDLLVPRLPALDAQAVAGRQFARGDPAGLPLLVSPTPLLLLGLLLDNRVVNRYLYRNYVIHKRCVGCGACVRYCPSVRLTMAGCYPRADGECTLCFSCVNRCPGRAMQIRFLSRYGQPYRPRCWGT